MHLGSLACCSPWGHKESGMTKQLNNNNKLVFIEITNLRKFSSVFFVVNLWAVSFPQ